MPIRPDDFDVPGGAAAQSVTASPTPPPPVLPPPPPDGHHTVAFSLAALAILVGAGFLAWHFEQPLWRRLTHSSIQERQTVPVTNPTPVIPQAVRPEPVVPQITGDAGKAPQDVPNVVEQKPAPAIPPPPDQPKPKSSILSSRSTSGLTQQTNPHHLAANRPPEQHQPANAAPLVAEHPSGQVATPPAPAPVEPPANQNRAPAVESSQSQPAETNRNVPHPAVTTNQPPRYSGPSSGTMTWQGEVNGTALLVLQNGHASFGTVAGSPLPGVLCMLQISDPKHFSVAAAPAPSNQWSKVVLNVRGKGTMNVKLTWAIP
jgi:hypothetical protein